jgi:hypothetical protein
MPIPEKNGITSTGSRLKNLFTLSMGVRLAILIAPFYKIFSFLPYFEDHKRHEKMTSGPHPIGPIKIMSLE